MDEKPFSKAGKNPNPRGQQKKTRVKTAKKRSYASTRWLQRQLNDPYVAEAQAQGFRSRAAFKLMQLDEQLGLLKKGQNIVDLGAAPGGWTQIIVDKVKPEETGAKVVALDILEMDELSGAIVLHMDFMDNDAPDKLKEALGGEGADLVVSDIAPPTIGHKQTDHLRIMSLVEAAYYFAIEVLKPGGGFVAKVFQGGAENDLLADMRLKFTKVKHLKPNASRSDSSEIYVVGLGFRG
mgnify:CR=1 FL=1